MQVAPQRADLPGALAAYLSPIFAQCCAEAPRLAVALSGGGDSMALTLLAKQWCDEQGRELIALTVDHQLRAESAIEAQQVATWMRALNIHHHILTPPPLPQISNIQARARQMRYGALTDWCRKKKVPVLLLAHHYDDQAETVALQKHRGDSPPSRAGMAFVLERDGVTLARPLLGVRKQALLDHLRAHGQAWIEDPSNENDFFARSRMRRMLGREARQALWQEAQLQGRLRQSMDVARNNWVAQHVTEDGAALLLDLAAWETLAEETRTDYLSSAIQAVGGKPFRPRHYETARLDGELLAKTEGKSTLGHCLLAWKDKQLRIAPEHPLDTAAVSSHMAVANPLKRLAKPPFWWFNSPPF